MTRFARVERLTGETQVLVELDLDGLGVVDVTTRVPFFDHMLAQLGKHASLDLSVRASGDIEVDAHEVDHLISLELGGSNSIRNLWPEPYAGRWGARTKDVLENTLHDLVCSGRLTLRYAQHIEATNWVAAYRRYVGGTPSATTASGSGGSSGGSTSAGGYYASSYPSARTIYCADDSEWRSLSKTYLVHFTTWAAAHRRFPAYHLHEPC